MRIIISIIIAMAANVAHAQGLFVESNFSDTQFTVKASALDIVRAHMPDPMDSAFITELKVLDVYHGDLTKGDTIELIIESDILKNFYRLALMQGEFLTSFCQSDTGVYYTNIIYPSTKENVQALEYYREHGTEGWDSHDCDYIDNKVDDPDGLYYTAPEPEYPGSHSSIKWRTDTVFMAAFQTAIQGHETADWVSAFKGIGHSRNQHVINGDQWLHMKLCEVNDCKYHNLSLLYNKEKAKVFALINAEKTYFTGEPSEEIRLALIALHDSDGIEKRLYDPAYYGAIREKQRQTQENQGSTSKTVNTLVDIYRKM